MEFSEDRKVKVLIVDDHAIVRQGMTMLINQEPEMHVCCGAEDVDQALRANRACHHDIAIVDMSLAGASGLEAVRRLLSEFPDLPILIVSMHDETIYAEPAMRAGARGYLMKQSATDTLLKAIRQVLQGDLYVSDSLRNRMLMKMMGKSNQDSPVANLSSSELEVLHLIGMGMGTSEIAQRLSRSVKTVETHKAKIKKKLKLESAQQLSLFAVNLVSSGTV